MNKIKLDKVKRKFEKTRLLNEGGSSFEFSDWEGIVDDMWNFIQQAIKEAVEDEKKRVVEEIKSNEELNEYLRNPNALGVRIKLDDILDKL